MRVRANGVNDEQMSCDIVNIFNENGMYVVGQGVDVWDSMWKELKDEHCG